jgi:hypothetical protein
MKLIKKKNKYTYRQYEIVERNNSFLLSAFENLDIVDLGSFENLDSVKKFIRKRDKEERDKNKCTICGYLKDEHKANTYNCPYDRKQHTWFLDTVFTPKKSD